MTERGVLLDLDGTLLDHRGAADQAAIEWAQKIDGLTCEDPISRWQDLERRFFPMFESGECSFQQQRRFRVREFSETLAHLSDADADALFDGYLTVYQRNWRSYAGAAELIDRAFGLGYRVGVLTNGDESQQRDKLVAIGLMRPKLQVFASSSLGYAKPAARAFELACAGLGTPPSQTAMVGDHYNRDVLAARAAGLRGIHVSHGPNPSRDESLGSLWAVASALFGND